MRIFLVAVSAAVLLAGTAGAAVQQVTVHRPGNTDLDGAIAAADIIAGLIATELAGDTGWHPANPASGDPNNPNGLPAFTDGIGDFSGVTGLLNDFPGAGNPTKLIQYDLAAATDVYQINVLSGNAGKDGRVFSTTVVQYSTDGGANFAPLGYFQSDPSGTLNPGLIGSTLVQIFDDSGSPLVAGATNLQFDFYAVDNTGGQMRDPFDGVNPFTGGDDGLTHAFVSPLIYEIDVLPEQNVIPEPSTLLLLGIGLAGLGILARRR